MKATIINTTYKVRLRYTTLPYQTIFVFFVFLLLKISSTKIGDTSNIKKDSFPLLSDIRQGNGVFRTLEVAKKKNSQEVLNLGPLFRV